MKIYALLLSLLLMIPFTGCTDKGDWFDSEYCYDGYQLHELDGTYPTSTVMSAGTEPIADEDCEGWENSIALEVGGHHIIDSREYNHNSVTLQFQSNTVEGANHSSLINYFTLTETSYHDYVECEPFFPIDIWDESGRFPNSTTREGASAGDASFTSLRYLNQHIHFADLGTYDEPIYLVVDNWHCMDEKADGTLVGDVYVDYWVGINNNTSEYFGSYYD